MPGAGSPEDGRRRGHRRGGRLGRTRLTPVTIALIAANVVAFSWEESDPTRIQQRFVMWPDGVHYLGQWYRVVTSAFLHENVEHILLNMFTLAVVGPPVEAETGRIRFVTLYLLAAAGGSVGFYLLANPQDGGLGASGAIFGLMGAYYVLAWLRSWEMQTITGLLILNIVFTFVTPNVAWQDHLGGLVTGVLACLGMVAGPGMRSETPAGARPSLGLVQVLQTVTVTITACVVFGLLLQLSPQAL